MIIDLLDGTTFEVRGVPEADLERFERVFQVFVGDVDGADLGGRSPMLGSYTIEASALRFSPRYPLMRGQRYTAVFDPGGPRRVVACFDVPRLEAPPARALQIYPTADVLPENLLRFHVCFSAPMREGEALRHVRLLSEDGREVEGVFADTGVELWDPSMTRLSLLLDPGRVKTGLAAHEALGRALVPGSSYCLVVDARFRDARGEPLESSLEKRFCIGPALSAPPDARRWAIEPPKARSRDPLSVRFPAPLDFVQLSLFVRIRKADGAGLQGEIAVGQDEASWQWRPEEPWDPGRYVLEIDRRLEDVAGNNLDGLFDRPGQSSQRAPRHEPVSLPFEIEQG